MPKRAAHLRRVQGKSSCLFLILTLSLIAAFMNGCTYVLDPYHADVRRNASSDFEQALITAAEAACPSEAELADACGVEMDPTEVCDWSCGETPYFKVPFAVTLEAVDYYQGLIEAYRQIPFPIAGAPRYARFRYDANVAFFESRYVPGLQAWVPVYEVNLDLGFVVVCGNLCGYDVNAERTVTFDTEGNILAIEGDEQRGYGVS